MKTRKLFVVALALVLTMSMTATAFAATSPTTIKSIDTDNSVTIDVTGNYEGGVTTPAVYSVDISWGEMNFAYNVAGTKEWDPASHTYTLKNGSQAWTATGNTITAANHSNKAVNVSFAFANDTTNAPNVTGFFKINNENNKTNFDLDPATEGSDVNAAPSNTATLELEGTLASEHAAQTNLGTVTVTVTAPVTP